ncbi:MAG: DUF3833 family protein [Sphingomicrobium sp.]
MRPRSLALAAPILIVAAPVPAPAAAAAASRQQVDPLRFFEGRTETLGTIKVMFKKPYRGRSLGQGRIEPDGSLTLVQRVLDEGQPPRERRWHVRRVGPGRFAGTMTDASGPVTIEQVGDRYRFRFTMKGNLKVEQWLTPLPGGASALNRIKVRRYGLVVATTEGRVRKL